MLFVIQDIMVAPLPSLYIKKTINGIFISMKVPNIILLKLSACLLQIFIKHNKTQQVLKQRSLNLRHQDITINIQTRIEM